jgi:hypothetical protein
MKIHRIPIALTVTGIALLSSGYATTNSETRVTNTNKPGPDEGAVGTVVGGVEGATAATKSTFTNEHRIIRTWRTENTADGRTIRVPVEIEVDVNGRPIEKK